MQTFNLVHEESREPTLAVLLPTSQALPATTGQMLQPCACNHPSPDALQTQADEPRLDQESVDHPGSTGDGHLCYAASQQPY
jgi:hypothetical protein